MVADDLHAGRMLRRRGRQLVIERPLRVLDTLTVDVIVIECPTCGGKPRACDYCDGRGKVAISSERSLVGLRVVWDQRR